MKINENIYSTKEGFILYYLEQGEKTHLGVVLTNKESLFKIKNVFKKFLDKNIENYNNSLKEFEGDPEEFDYKPIILQLLKPLEKEMEFLNTVKSLEDFKNSKYMLVYKIDVII